MSGDLINYPGLYESAAKNLPEEVRERLRVITKQLIAGEDYDKIKATYPNSTTEVYTYTLATDTILVITVTYLTAAKKDIDEVTFV